MGKKGGGRSYDIIKVDALILRQKSKPVFSWYVDVNDQWFLVRNPDFFIKAKILPSLILTESFKEGKPRYSITIQSARSLLQKKKKKQTYKQKCSLQRRVPFISTNH